MKLEIRGLNKTFASGKQVLYDINADMDIRTLAIIGPSGDGKSTLLRILGGLLAPSSGEMKLEGEHVEDSPRYRKGLGFVFQQGGLFAHMTALHNITVPLEKVHGQPKEQAEQTAISLLRRFGLQHDAHKRPYELSGGQKQRIAIARAIAPKQKLLLLDEPTSALDPEYTVEVLDMLNELKNDGINFVIVTHEMGFARHACEQVALLYGGKLIEQGKSDDFFENPKTEELKRFLSKLIEWKV